MTRSLFKATVGGMKRTPQALKNARIPWVYGLGLALVLAGSGSLLSRSAWATVDEFPELREPPSSKKLNAPLSSKGGALWFQDLSALFSFNKKPTPSAAELFRRSQAVLAYFGVPVEPDSQSLLDPLRDHQSLNEAKRILPFLDFEGDQFSRFSRWEEAPSRIPVSQDRDSKEVSDFEFSLSAEDSPLSAPGIPEGIADRLRSAALGNSDQQPLLGLRIAIDPGHMGGEFWDEHTGKWIENPQGRRISEGLIVLQTALLLEKELTALGAEVMLTRRTLEPVQEVPLQSLDLTQYGRLELRQSTLQSWFQELLAEAPAGSELFQAFDEHARVKQAFAERSRTRHFIGTADTDARAEKIHAFDADLTLILHYDVRVSDASPHGLNPADYNATKAYVPGAFVPEELSSRQDRALFAKHLLSREAWDASVRLSREIVGAIHRDLKVALDPTGGTYTRLVEPGVFSRNLALNRRLSGRAFSFLEILYYNGPSEFNRLSRADHSMAIGGVDYPYSNRLIEIARTIRRGVVETVRSYRNTPAPN